MRSGERGRDTDLSKDKGGERTALTVAGGSADELKELPELERGASVGHFIIIEQLGEGGMGVVYSAYDPDLDRKVAIKLLSPGASGEGRKGRVARLFREAQAMARLSHPNVATVYEVGLAEEHVYIAMELVDGTTLRDWLDAEERSPNEIASIFIEAGRGLAAAHEAGLVHRDFKPHNVIIGAEGRVRVLDFGLARAGPESREEREDLKDLRDDASPHLDQALTRAGAVVGTPAYMAPEQYLGQAVDARSDQFSFCVALYEALYGERPFAGDTLADLSDEVIQGRVREPPPGRRVSSRQRRILERGLQRARRDRYPSMGALLEELGRDARAPRKRIALVAGLVGLVGALIVVRWGLPGESEKLVQSSDRQAQAEARKARDATRMAVAARLVDSDPTSALLVLREVEDPSAAPGWVTDVYDVTRFGIARFIVRHEDGVESAVFSADGARVVTVSDKTARVWNADGTGEPVVLRHENKVMSAVFSPDGTRVVTASWDKSARVWNADGTGEPVVLHHDALVSSAVFSPDGTRVATVSPDQTVRVWNADGTGEPVALHHDAPVTGVAFSPDGTRLVLACSDKVAQVRSADGTGKPVVLRHEDGAVTSVAFSPDGAWVVTTSFWLGSYGNAARVWRADGRGEPVVLRSEGMVGSAAFSPDGTRVVIGSSDNTARVWHANGSGTPVVLRHDAGVKSVAFSRDGTRLVTVSYDNTARVWNADGSGGSIVLRHPDEVASAAFSPDGAWVVTASRDKTARIWSANGAGASVVLRHKALVESAAFSPDGTRVVTASRDKTARVWSVDGAGEPVVLRHEEGVRSAAFSPDGTRVVTTPEDIKGRFGALLGGPPTTMCVRVWNANGVGEPVSLCQQGVVESAAFGPDGTRVLTTWFDVAARVWNADGTGEPVVLHGEGEKPYVEWGSPGSVPMESGSVGDGTVFVGASLAAFSPDGDRVVTVFSGSDKIARIWSANGAGEPVQLRHPARVSSANFSPDGTRVLTYSDAARVWNADGTGEPLLLDQAGAATFSPDGTRAVAVCSDRTVRVWSVDGTGEPVVLRPEDEVRKAVFSPDGTRVLTRSDETVQVWNADGTGKPVVLRHETSVEMAVFSADGIRVMTKSRDNAVRVWNADGTGEPAVLRGGDRDAFFRSAELSPDGTRVLTRGERTARVWLLDAGQIMRRLWHVTFDCLPTRDRTRLLGEDDDTANARVERCRERVARAPGRGSTGWRTSTADE